MSIIKVTEKEKKKRGFGLVILADLGILNNVLVSLLSSSHSFEDSESQQHKADLLDCCFCCGWLGLFKKQLFKKNMVLIIHHLFVDIYEVVL